MNKKILFFSIVSTGFLILTLAGCDWCSCCKKENSEPKTEQASAHPVQPAHPDSTEPKAMPEAVHPRIATPIMPKPVEPIAPKVAPMPIAPKIA